MNRLWIFLINPFLSATKGSFRLAMKLSFFTDSGLHAHMSDAAILAMYNIYHPMHTAFAAAYNAWDAQKSTQIANTSALNNLLEGLSAKYDTWEYAIRGVYAKTSTQYENLFAHGKSVFTSGTQLDRIQAVSSLNTNLTGIAALAATKTDVNNTYNALQAALLASSDNKSITNTLSTAVEVQRLIICNGLYSVLGKLMDKFNTNPAAIADYIDVESLRNIQQTDFVGHVAGNSFIDIVHRTLDATQFITLRNTGNTPLRFYLAALKTDAIGAVYFEVPPMTDHDITANQLGDVTTQHFINVLNVDALMEGHFEMIID